MKTMKGLFTCLVGAGLLAAAAPSMATHLLVGVDPITGQSTFFMAGVASPGTGRPSVSDMSSSPAPSVPMDPESALGLMAMAMMDSDIIAAILQNNAAISQENDVLRQQLIAGMSEYLGGDGPGDPGAGPSDINEIIANLIRGAVEGATVSEEQMRQFIARAASYSSGEQERGTGQMPAAGPREREADARREQERLLQQRQLEQQRLQAEREAREDLAAAARERIEQRQREEQERVKRAAEEAKRKAEEALKAKMSDQERRRYEEQQARSQARDQEREQLAARVLAGQSAGPRNPSAPATPESHRDHLAAVAGAPSGADTVDGEPPASPGKPLDDVHTDFANQQERDDSLEQVASAAAWEDFLANRDGPGTDEFPSESIYGKESGTYNGLVRGEFDGGAAANGTLQMNISFLNQEAHGEIRFDDNQGTMQFEGWVGDVGFELSMEGQAFGGAADGYLYGELYGPRGEEVGGDWGMSVLEGEFSDQFASGRFAAKQ